jgi:Holliday junction resolvase
MGGLEVNTTEKGAERERKTIRRLRDQGYEAIRSPASKGLFDVWAIDSTGLYPIVRYIQVKSNTYVYGDERRALEAFALNNPSASVEVWRWDDHARAPLVRVYQCGQWIDCPAE